MPPHLLFANPKIKQISDLKGKTVMVGGSADITRIYAERISLGGYNDNST